MIARNPLTKEVWIILKNSAIEIGYAESSLSFKDRTEPRSKINLFIDTEAELNQLLQGLRRVRKYFKKAAQHKPHKEKIAPPVQEAVELKDAATVELLEIQDIEDRHTIRYALERLQRDLSIDGDVRERASRILLRGMKKPQRQETPG